MSSTVSTAHLAREELSDFRGQLIGPDSPDYEQARAVFNAVIDRHPALIARCADAADVAHAIRFAREHELLDLMSFEWVVEVSGVSFSARHQRIDAFKMVFVAKAFTFRLETAPTFFVEAVEVTDSVRVRKTQ